MLNPREVELLFSKELASLLTYRNHWLNLCGPDQLKLECGEIVDLIDGTDFERVRLLAQKLVDMGILNEGSQPSGDQTLSDQHTTNDNTSASLDDSADYKAAEAELTKVYAELRSHLSEKEKLALKKEEVAWLTKRSRLRGDSAAFIAETRARIRELTSRLRY